MRKMTMKMKREFLACPQNRARNATNVLPLGRDSWSTSLFIQVFISIRFLWCLFSNFLLEIPGAKCLVEECDWTNPVPKDKSRLKQHMLSAHTESIPTARTAATH